jgi:uncharacterized protein YcnI
MEKPEAGWKFEPALSSEKKAWQREVNPLESGLLKVSTLTTEKW